MLLKKIRNDGAKNTANNIFKAISSFFYRKTYTVMLKRESSETYSFYDDRVKELKLEDFKSSFLLNLSKKKFIQWNKNNSVTLILEIDEVEVGYIVVHFTNYYVSGLGNIDLDEKKMAWVGPVFVALKHRGKGFNKVLIDSALDLCNKSDRQAYTSTNIDNIASIRSFEKYDFRIIQIFKSKYLFNKVNVTKVLKEDV